MKGEAGGTLRVRSARTRAAKDRKRGGFTLIELAVSVSILLIGIVAVVNATSRMHSLRKFNREKTIAQNGLRSMGERIHARSYELKKDKPNLWSSRLVAEYSAGGAYGTEFEVIGINVELDENAQGSIRVLTDETLTDEDLGFQVGMPRDLNGDGDATDVDVTADAHILPVLLTVRWRGQSGQVSIDEGFYVTGY